MAIYDLCFILVITLLSDTITMTGCIRRPSDNINEDYDEIDRRFPPLFINNTRTKVVAASGKTATLECRVQNLEDRTVSWIRQRDLHILTMDTTVYSNDRRVEVVQKAGQNGTRKRNNKRADSDWILHIHQAHPSDSGIYECQINTEPKKSKEYHLHIVVSRARILGDRDVLVQVGSDINLTCRAEESPDVPETVTWYKNEQRVDNLLARGGISVVTESRRRSSNLLVSKVTKEDAGNYTCVPSNARADSVMVHVIDGADPRANMMANHGAFSTQKIQGFSCLHFLVLLILRGFVTQ